MRNYLATLINSENLIPEVKSQGGQDVLRAQWRSSAFIAALYGAAAGLNVFAVIFVNARMSDNDVFAFSKVGSCSEDNPFVTCNYNFFNLCVFFASKVNVSSGCEYVTGNYCVSGTGLGILSAFLLVAVIVASRELLMARSNYIKLSLFDRQSEDVDALQSSREEEKQSLRFV